MIYYEAIQKNSSGEATESDVVFITGGGQIPNDNTVRISDETVNNLIFTCSGIGNSVINLTLTNAEIVSRDCNKEYNSNYVSRNHGAWRLRRTRPGVITITPTANAQFHAVWGY